MQIYSEMSTPTHLMQGNAIAINIHLNKFCGQEKGQLSKKTLLQKARLKEVKTGFLSKHLKPIWSRVAVCSVSNKIFALKQKYVK